MNYVPAMDSRPGSESATSGIEAFLRRTVAPTAGAVAQLARDLGVTKVNEQRHLAPSFRDVLTDAVEGSPYRTARAGERKLGDRPEWLGVGDVDRLVAGPGGPAWVELKCGSDHEALCACAWDAPKMALAVSVGRAAHAYLLAATTSEQWRRGIRGAEFFGERRIERTVENRERFADWWAHWEKRDPLPIRLPAVYATELVAHERFEVATTEYELRLTRVEVVGDERYDWEPFLTPEQRRNSR
jgi:hypothetical protein